MVAVGTLHSRGQLTNMLTNDGAPRQGGAQGTHGYGKRRGADPGDSSRAGGPARWRRVHGTAPTSSAAARRVRSPRGQRAIRRAPAKADPKTRGVRRTHASVHADGVPLPTKDFHPVLLHITRIMGVGPENPW